MKKIKLAFLTLLALPLLVGCGPDGGGGGGGGTGDDDPPVPPDPPIDERIDVTVTYYLDYNMVAAKEIYKTETVKNGSKLVKPDNPATAPSVEFPTFKGWSTYQIINDDSFLWDFDKDIVNIEEGAEAKITLYGIWTD